MARWRCAPTLRFPFPVLALVCMLSAARPALADREVGEGGGLATVRVVRSWWWYRPGHSGWVHRVRRQDDLTGKVRCIE